MARGSRLKSGISGALSGAASGAGIGAAVGAPAGGIGAAPAALIGGGIGLLAGGLGGALTPDEEYTAEELALAKAKFEEDKRQFGQTMDFQKEQAGRANRFKGIEMLSANRAQAADLGKRYAFNNALYSVLSGKAS